MLMRLDLKHVNRGGLVASTHATGPSEDVSDLLTVRIVSLSAPGRGVHCSGLT